MRNKVVMQIPKEYSVYNNNVTYFFFVKLRFYIILHYCYIYDNDMEVCKKNLRIISFIGQKTRTIISKSSVAKAKTNNKNQIA